MPILIAGGLFFPNLLINYVLASRYYPYINSGRSYVVNMYLRPNGRQVIIETRNGEMKIVNNMDIYDAKVIKNRF